MNATCMDCGGPTIGRNALRCRNCYTNQHRCIDCNTTLRHSTRLRCKTCWDLVRPRTNKHPTPKNWDVDEVAVLRLSRGYPVQSNPSERRIAALELTRIGIPVSVIADRLRVTPRTVERYRASA